MSLLLPHYLVPQHLGGLHPYEQLLVLALAFGPFVVLGLVVAAQRRRAVAAEEAEEAETAEDAGGTGRRPEQTQASEPDTPGRPGSPPSAP